MVRLVLMKSSATLILALLLLTGASATLSGARLSFFRLEKSNNDVLVTWQAEVEDDVHHYVLKRRTPASNDQYVELAQIPAQGATRLYSYRDGSVYKSASELVDYQLWVVGNDGTWTKASEASVNYTATAVRRTWGSIKAMFQ